MQGQNEGYARLLDGVAQLVDDMAALLSSSVLQLLGGCRGAAVSWEALQASAVSLHQHRRVMRVKCVAAAAAVTVCRPPGVPWVCRFREIRVERMLLVQICVSVSACVSKRTSGTHAG
jgi:hypothetical protein